MSAPIRDYSLTGPESQRAAEAGLAMCTALGGLIARAAALSRLMSPRSFDWTFLKYPGKTLFWCFCASIIASCWWFSRDLLESRDI